MGFHVKTLRGEARFTCDCGTSAYCPPVVFRALRAQLSTSKTELRITDWSTNASPSNQFAGKPCVASTMAESNTVKDIRAVAKAELLQAHPNIPIAAMEELLDSVVADTEKVIKKQ